MKNFDIMADFVVDHSIDYDIFTSRSRSELTENKEDKEKKLKEMDLPELQKQIVNI